MSAEQDFSPPDRSGPDPIGRVVIVGGGSAGWMAAAALARAFGRTLNITLVESEEIGTVGVGEATIPQIKVFNEFLGLDEDAFLKATRGSFKLGIQFNGWGREGQSYIHAFGDIGLPLGLLPFHHYWLQARAGDAGRGGAAGRLWDYSLNAVAAAANRFDRLQRVEGTPMAGLAYAFHFDASLYARALRRYAAERGVQRIEGRIEDVLLAPDSGFITEVVLADGRRAAGDFFLDCSGFRGLLIEGALKAGYEDWTHWLPCDRAVAVPSETVRPFRPYTQATAGPAGWRWRIPLQHRTGNGHVYCSAHMSDDEAARGLLENIEGAAAGDPRFLKFTTGRRRRQWVKNCLSLGLASGFMEPLESTSLHLIQTGVSRLVSCFPDKRCAPHLVDAYNRQSQFEFERIRDFLILHYNANERAGEYWRACREMSVPDTLLEKRALFEESGRLFREADELFTETGWVQVLTGQGIAPRAVHPLAGAPSADQIGEYFAHVRRIVERGITALPLHADFIAEPCAA